MSDEFVRVTFKIAISPITGAEIVVISSRTAAMKMKMTPIQ
jgi:hypothetical protein